MKKGMERERERERKAISRKKRVFSRFNDRFVRAIITSCVVFTSHKFHNGHFIIVSPYNTYYMSVCMCIDVKDQPLDFVDNYLSRYYFQLIQSRFAAYRYL